MSADPRGHSDAWDAAWKAAGGAWFESPGFVEAFLERFERFGGLAAPVLDVGCGRGRLVARLRGRVAGGVHGVDFAFSSLRGGEPGCVQGSALSLPVRSGACNTVTAVLLIEHLPDVEGFFAEASRVLAPGGLLHLVFPNLFSLVTPALFLKRRIAGGREIPWHKPLGAAWTAKALERAGLEVAGVDYLSIGAYRGGLDRVLSDAVRVLLPRRFREEVVLTGRKPDGLVRSGRPGA